MDVSFEREKEWWNIWLDFWVIYDADWSVFEDNKWKEVGVCKEEGWRKVWKLFCASQVFGWPLFIERL